MPAVLAGDYNVVPTDFDIYPWLEIECSRCKTPRDVDLASLRHPPTICVHDLASRLRCRKCVQTGRRPAATLLQLAQQARNRPSET